MKSKITILSFLVIIAFGVLLSITSTSTAATDYCEHDVIEEECYFYFFCEDDCVQDLESTTNCSVNEEGELEEDPCYEDEPTVN